MDKNNYSFSVVIPTYNHADFLKQALQSVIDQKHKDWEAIVVDNHSSDHTDEVIKSFRDSRIKIHKIYNNGVIAASRNLGINLSTKEWIAFLDSDDKWYPNKLKEVSKILLKINSYDVITTDEYKVFHDKKKKTTLRYGPLPKNSYEHMLIYGNRLSPSATIVRKSFLQKKGIAFNEDKNYITVEDYDFWLHLALSGAKFKFIPSVQGEYHVHSSNNSSREEIHHNNEIHLLEDHIFNIQGFAENKNKLLKRIECRLKICDSINNLRQENINSFIVIFFKALVNHPLGSLLYLLERMIAKIKNYFYSFMYNLNKLLKI